MMTFIICALIWWAFGSWSHVYWLTNKYDYETKDILTSLFSGFTGPLGFWIGWIVYGDERKSKPLLRKRS